MNVDRTIGCLTALVLAVSFWAIGAGTSDASSNGSCAAQPAASADEPTPEELRDRRIFLKELPSGLKKRIADNLATLSKDLPLSAEAAAEVRAYVGKIDPKWTHRNKDAREALQYFGTAAVPVLAELLTSEDDTVRQKAVVGLKYLAKPKERVLDYWSVSEKTMVAVFRRCTFDRKKNIRRLAIGALYTMGMARYRNIPEGIKIGLEQVAVSDPDPKLRDLAQEARETLGLAPASPDREYITD